MLRARQIAFEQVANTMTYPIVAAVRFEPGDRAEHFSDPRIIGTIECYEYPPYGGRVFLKSDNDEPSYWFHTFQLKKVD
jgi:hypothetical protein